LKNSKDYSKVSTLKIINQSVSQLDEDILKYTNLKELDISGNQLKELPEFLKEFKYLECINISRNQFTAYKWFKIEKITCRNW